MVGDESRVHQAASSSSGTPEGVRGILPTALSIAIRSSRIGQDIVCTTILFREKTKLQKIFKNVAGCGNTHFYVMTHTCNASTQ